MNKIVRVGIGVFIFKNGKFLMGQRNNSHGSGSWSIPGGHLEFSETFEDTAKREVFEEVGLTIKNLRIGAVTNDYFEYEGKQYVTVWMLSDLENGKEHIKEPEKMTQMQWCDFENLPKPLFLPWQHLLNSRFIDYIKNELQKSQKK